MAACSALPQWAAGLCSVLAREILTASSRLRLDRSSPCLSTDGSCTPLLHDGGCSLSTCRTVTRISVLRTSSICRNVA